MPLGSPTTLPLGTLLKKPLEVITWAVVPAGACACRISQATINGVGRELTSKQKGVVRGVIPAAVASLLGLCGASQFIPVRALPVDDVAARIEWGMQWALLPILTLTICVMRVANHRFTSPEDIDGSGLTAGTDRVRLLQAILQNTLEQSVLAVAAYLIWATVMPHGWLRAIPIAALLFVTGRILFARGYQRGAPGRATGFGLTAYPNFGMLITIAAVLGYRLASWAVK